MNNFDVRFQTNYSDEEKNPKKVSFTLTLMMREHSISLGQYVIFPSLEHRELILMPKYKFSEWKAFWRTVRNDPAFWKRKIRWRKTKKQKVLYFWRRYSGSQKAQKHHFSFTRFFNVRLWNFCNTSIQVYRNAPDKGWFSYIRSDRLKWISDYQPGWCMDVLCKQLFQQFWTKSFLQQNQKSNLKQLMPQVYKICGLFLHKR